MLKLILFARSSSSQHEKYHKGRDKSNRPRSCTIGVWSRSMSNSQGRSHGGHGSHGSIRGWSSSS